MMGRLLSVRETLEYAVLKDLLGGTVTLEDACRRLQLHRSTVWRKLELIREEGPSGLAHGLRGQPSNRRRQEHVRKDVCALFEHEFKPYGFNVAHFYEQSVGKFAEPVSYPTVVRWLRAAKLVEKAHKGHRHRSRRPRKEAFGEMLQMDTSIHDWLGIGEKYALVSAMDDATNQLCGVILAHRDTTLANMAVLKETVKTRGIPMSLYIDRSPIFRVTRTGGIGRIIQPTYKAKYITQVQRALDQLGVEMIYALSPQAKGRIERSFGTWQNRLVPELRKLAIRCPDQANAYIRDEFRPRFNKQFARPLDGVPSTFVDPGDVDIDAILSVHYQCTVGNDNVVSSKRAGVCLQLLPGKKNKSYAKTKVHVRKHTDGRVEVLYNGGTLPYRELEPTVDVG